MTETLSPALPDAVEAAARRVLETASDRALMLATAESCTGGLLASLLTDIEGVSSVFERGLVVYSEDAKCDLLHVARATIDRCGAVSRDVAIAMAEGVLSVSPADLALAVTGFAGRGGPGVVHFACARRGGATAHREEHFGDIGRGPVRVKCMQVALDMLEAAL